ncbi:MAG: hypothetical protein KIT80_11825 [Chitinophagaceae bacterium]|nr:hypothetical protein [Chitinophagaceae bacterium]MCW5927590.1 hypothetical protein [Chitinophagaceae bacterium]
MRKVSGKNSTFCVLGNQYYTPDNIKSKNVVSGKVFLMLVAKMIFEYNIKSERNIFGGKSTLKVNSQVGQYGIFRLYIIYIGRCLSGFDR